MLSGGLELTNLTYTRLEDNLTRHHASEKINKYIYSRVAIHPAARYNACEIVSSLVGTTSSWRYAEWCRFLSL